MSDSNNLAYITAYAGGSIELLNLDFLHNGSLSYSTIKGGSTFLGFFSDLQQLGFLSFEINDTFPLTSTGLQIGNVYTAIGNVISDYGLFGNYLLMLFQGFVFSLSYENFKKSKSLFSTSSIIYIIIVPAMFYLSISSAFTRDYLCMNTAIEIIFLVLCVKFQRRAKWSKKKSTCFFIKQNAS